MKQITIIGTGMIGGSFALAIKKRGFQGKIIGCDREAVLQRAKKLGAIDSGVTDPAHACRGSEVVLLATPVGAIIDLIERLAPVLPASTLITDVGSTKAAVVERARAVLGQDAGKRFLPGHPMAGKEHCGIEHADPDLFEDAVWLVTPLPGHDLQHGPSGAFVRLVNGLGGRVVAIDAELHDRICAWTSQLPQMLATALAGSLADFERETKAANPETPDLNAIGGRALREMTRIAASPYSMWRDIAFTNSENIQQALLRLEQRLAHLRENLRSRELEAEFERASKFVSPRKHGGTEPPESY